jgi:hypothetical protein
LASGADFGIDQFAVLNAVPQLFRRAGWADRVIAGRDRERGKQCGVHAEAASL